MSKNDRCFFQRVMPSSPWRDCPCSSHRSYWLMWLIVEGVWAPLCFMMANRWDLGQARRRLNISLGGQGWTLRFKWLLPTSRPLRSGKWASLPSLTPWSVMREVPWSDDGSPTWQILKSSQGLKVNGLTKYCTLVHAFTASYSWCSLWKN